MESGRTLRSFLTVRKRTRNDGYPTKTKDTPSERHSLKKTRSESDLSEKSTSSPSVVARRYGTRTSRRISKPAPSDEQPAATAKVAPISSVKRKDAAEKAAAAENHRKDEKAAAEEEEHADVAKEPEVQEHADNEQSQPKEEEEESSKTASISNDEPLPSTECKQAADTAQLDSVSGVGTTTETAHDVNSASTPASSAIKDKAAEKEEEEEEASLTPPQLVCDKPKTFTAAAPAAHRPATHVARYTPLLLKSTATALPDHYEVLIKILAALDHTIVFMRGQRQRCIYHKIRASVEDMCRRQFELRHLAQLKTVYPEAYVFESASIVVNGERRPSIIIDMPASDGEAASLPAEQWLARDHLTRRRDQLRDRLVALLREQHQAFLATAGLDGKWDKQADEAWHPDFDMSSATDIALAPLPLPTEVPVAKARRLHLFGRKKPATPEEMKQKLATLSTSGSAGTSTQKDELETSDKPAATATATTTTASTKTNGKGLAARAAALLDRIRQKSKQRGSLTLAEESAQSRQKALHSRLPSVVDALAFMSSSLGKRVLPLKDVARRLASSTEDSLISESEAYELIKRFTEVAPNWCGLSTTAGVAYIRIHRPLNSTQIKAELGQTATADHPPATPPSAQ